MSSIDDEFASLFLPDLDLIKSLGATSTASNGFNTANDKRFEDLQTTPYSMTSLPIETTHEYDNGTYSNTTSSHWLHHYGKLNNTFGFPLDQLQSPYIGYNGLQHLLQIPQQSNYPLNIDQSTNDVATTQDFLNFQRAPEILESSNTQFSQQDAELKETFSESSYPNLESSNSPAPSLLVQGQSRPLSFDGIKKKKESSSEYSHLLNLVLEKADESIVIYDKEDRKTDFHASGEIDGRFLYSESDLRDPSTTRISCYRRNFLQISFNFELDHGMKFMSTSSQKKLTITGLKFAVYATTNFSDDKIELMIFGNDGKKSAVEPGTTYMKNTLQEIPLETVSKGFSGKFALKKAQFRNATPNNGKSTIFQNYYYILVSITAKTAEIGDVPLLSLKSVPIKVRGRNPSFYNDRNDILITKNTFHPQSKDILQDSSVSRPKPESLEQDEMTTVPNPVKIETKDHQDTSLYLQKRENTNVDIKNPVPLPFGKNSRASNSPDSPQAKTPSNYQYFPLSNVYYLPPIDAHYFPHGVHHPRQSSIVRHREQTEGQQQNNNIKGSKVNKV